MVVASSQLPLVVRDLKKNFGKVNALNGVSFTINRGEIFGLIGPNGAGKTTTLRIIATLLLPTDGGAKVYGFDVVREASKVRELIGYLPEEAGAYKNLKGIEFLKFIARFSTRSEGEEEEMIGRAKKISGLGDRLGDKIKTYSKGMLRRLLLSATLMKQPRLALLDEPTSGLDVVNAHKVRLAIREYVRGTGAAVLLSSHNMLEVEFLCDRVAIIHRGRIVAEGEPKRLLEKFSAENLEEVFVKVVGG